jgi:hypothetical protein
MAGRVGLKSDLQPYSPTALQPYTPKFLWVGLQPDYGLGRRGRGTLPPYPVILGMDQTAAAGGGVPGSGLRGGGIIMEWLRNEQA